MFMTEDFVDLRTVNGLNCSFISYVYCTLFLSVMDKTWGLLSCVSIAIE